MRLLVAEDEESLSRALCVILEKSGYSVDAVYDGVEALEYLEAGGNYDGVILDIMMPRMDGLTVLKKLRAAGNSIPVLFLTAKSEIDDKVEGLDLGANDYLTKPFAAKELLARIRVMTRGTSAAAADSTLRCGNIVLNRATNELSSPTGSYVLSNKEFQVIEMLMANPRNIIPTEHFIEKIWGYDTDVETNVVWVYLSYLRKKLTALQANVQIRASRNAGYSLEVKE